MAGCLIIGTGDLTDSSNPENITITRNMSVEATFTNYDDVIFHSNFEAGNLINVHYVTGDASGYRHYTANVNL